MMTRRLSRFVAASSLLGLIALAGASVTDESRSLADDPAMVKRSRWCRSTARAPCGAKGLFGVHTWVAVKPTDAPDWTVYEVIGWRLRWTDTAVVVRNRAPDALVRRRRRALRREARRRRRRADQAHRQGGARLSVRQANTRSGPGRTRTPSPPGSRARCPSCEVDLPATAIGKDYLGGRVIGAAPSGSGFQFSLARPARRRGERRRRPRAQRARPQFRRRPLRAQAAAGRAHRLAAIAPAAVDRRSAPKPRRSARGGNP